MTQELPKHELLLKLLKMTASSNDAEALAAIRKANQLLAIASWDWDRLLAGKITVVGDPFGNLHRPQASQSTEMPREAPRAPSPRPAPQQAFNTQRAAAQGNRRRAKPVINYSDIFGGA
jgi:hypothetical protein